MALVVGALIASCSLPTRTVHDFCAIEHPILISKSDNLTDQTAREILTHNETGAQLCGWGKK